MKKLFRTFVNFVAAAMLAVAVFSFAGCEDIKKVQLDLSVYNLSSENFYDKDDVALSLDLYRHLAPETVDAVVNAVNSEYYNGAIFYVDTAYPNQIMVGDLKFENGELVRNLIDGKDPAMVHGEFEYNGTTGSDLKNQKGYVGLWRGWYASNTNTYKTSNAMDTGRAVWYIPTSTITSYDGYFCVFATFDAGSTAITAIPALFNSESTYTEYIIYYTGEYVAADNAVDNGLTFHAVKAEDFDEDEIEEDIFVAEGDQLACYNKKTVKIPVKDGEVYGIINSAVVK